MMYWALKFTGLKLFKSVMYLDTILKILTGPSEMEEDHQISGGWWSAGPVLQNVNL